MLSNGDVKEVDIAVCTSMKHMEFGLPIEDQPNESNEGEREKLDEEKSFECDPTN